MGQIKYHTVVLVGNNKGWLTLKAVILWPSRDKLNGQAFVSSKLVNWQEQRCQLLILKTWLDWELKYWKEAPPVPQYLARCCVLALVLYRNLKRSEPAEMTFELEQGLASGFASGPEEAFGSGRKVNSAFGLIQTSRHLV